MRLSLTNITAGQLRNCVSRYQKTAIPQVVGVQILYELPSQAKSWTGSAHASPHGSSPLVEWYTFYYVLQYLFFVILFKLSSSSSSVYWNIPNNWILLLHVKYI